MKDLKTYATDDITPTMAAFAEWLQAETGYAVDARSVALAGSLRGNFQQSESWKNDPRNPVLSREANREAKAKAALESAERAAQKAQARIAKLEQAVKDAKAKAKTNEAKAA